MTMPSSFFYIRDSGQQFKQKASNVFDVPHRLDSAFAVTAVPCALQKHASFPVFFQLLSTVNCQLSLLSPVASPALKSCFRVVYRISSHMTHELYCLENLWKLEQLVTRYSLIDS